MTSPNLEKLFSELLHDVNRPFANLDMFVRMIKKKYGDSEFFDEGASEILEQSAKVREGLELVQRYFSEKKVHVLKGKLYLERAISELGVSGEVEGTERSILSIIVDAFRMLVMGMKQQNKINEIRVVLEDNRICFLFSGTGLTRSDIESRFQLSLRPGTHYAVFNKYLHDHGVEYCFTDTPEGLELIINGH